MAFARARENRRGRLSGRAAWKRRLARSGCHASFVASPAQTRSQSAGRATSPSSPVAASRSYQKSAPPLSASLISWCASPSGGGSAPACDAQRSSRNRARPAEPGADPDDLADAVS